MKVSSMYHSGKEERKGDGSFLCHPFFGVLDGTGSPHCPEHPQLLYRGLTDEEVVTVLLGPINPCAMEI